MCSRLIQCTVVLPQLPTEVLLIYNTTIIERVQLCLQVEHLSYPQASTWSSHNVIVQPEPLLVPPLPTPSSMSHTSTNTFVFQPLPPVTPLLDLDPNTPCKTSLHPPLPAFLSFLISFHCRCHCKFQNIDGSESHSSSKGDYNQQAVVAVRGLKMGLGWYRQQLCLLSCLTICCLAKGFPISWSPTPTFLCHIMSSR